MQSFILMAAEDKHRRKKKYLDLPDIFSHLAGVGTAAGGGGGVRGGVVFEAETRNEELIASDAKRDESGSAVFSCRLVLDAAERKVASTGCKGSRHNSPKD